MAYDRKQLLVVDDMEIDRMMLRSILSREFDILEADGGNMAFEYITTKIEQLDAILLDISMPHINGFDVLRFMEDKEISGVPVFLMTAEPTRDNVERAMKHNIADFITKPFDPDEVLRRLRSRLGISPKFDLNQEDLKATWAYISDLEGVFKRYLANFGKNDSHYQVMVDLMRIMLNQHNRNLRDNRLSPDAIELISKAAYFCDIGNILVPDKRLQVLIGRSESDAMQRNHTRYGAQLVRLNKDKSCEYFVEICSSMCLNHHERYDGRGYPHGYQGNENSIFNQMCLLVDEFDQLRSKFYGDKLRPVRFVTKRLVNNDPDMVNPKLYEILENSERMVMDYFMKEEV